MDKTIIFKAYILGRHPSENYGWFVWCSLVFKWLGSY